MAEGRGQKKRKNKEKKVQRLKKINKRNAVANQD